MADEKKKSKPLPDPTGDIKQAALGASDAGHETEPAPDTDDEGEEDEEDS